MNWPVGSRWGWYPQCVPCMTDILYLSLVERVPEVSDRYAVSIFINPKQFSTGEAPEV